MKFAMRKLFVLAMFLWSSVMMAQVGDLPRVAPQQEGVSQQGLSAFYNGLMALPSNEIHGVMVLRHGRVVGELFPAPFKAEYQHILYSCSKTFVSAAVGIAIGENRLRLDDRVGTLLIDKLPDEVSDNLAEVTVRHLLTMSSGIEPDGLMRNFDTDWIKTYLAKPVSEPGKLFKYDSMCTYLLSAIVQAVTGQKVLDYLTPRVFEPLHILTKGWEESAAGINVGGWGLHLQAESLAKFGQLLLQKGEWQGRQLIPAEWVEQMMQKQIDNGQYGYGYQMWMCEHTGAARADGAYGQYIFVIPDKEMVVVITECNTGSADDVFKQVWNLLDTVSDGELTEKGIKMADYSLPVMKGKATSAVLKQLEGKNLVLPQNDYHLSGLTIQSAGKNQLKLHVVKDDGSSYDIACGYGQWITSWSDVTPPYSVKYYNQFVGVNGPWGVAGCYAWKNKLLQVKAHYVNWISSLLFTFMPISGGVEITITSNYNTQPLQLMVQI